MVISAKLDDISALLSDISKRLPKPPASRRGLRREGNLNATGTISISTPSMRQIMVLSRGEYWRQGSAAFIAGFFTCRFLEHSASPQVEHWTVMAVAILALIVFTGSRSRRKRPLERP